MFKNTVVDCSDCRLATDNDPRGYIVATNTAFNFKNKLYRDFIWFGI